jgi:hypothetical protein
MWDDIREKLNSRNASLRRTGWYRLLRESTKDQFALSAAQIKQLHECRWKEDDMEVWRAAVNVMLELPLHNRSKDAETSPWDSLGNWLWDPFKDPSLVFRVLDPRSRRRDEDAVILLARHLSRREFPHTEFLRIPLDKPLWGEVLENRPCQALCIVGRLGLFGDHAVQFWSKKDTRFRFISEHRPDGLPWGKVDPRFHCICERISASGEEGYSPAYPTTEQNGQRTDYGLVQRYEVLYKTKKVCVVVCAGASSLGTFAAVQWAADQSVGRHLNEALIPLPERVRADSTLEALLEVTADLSPSANSWQPLHLRLVKLCVDGSVWSEEERDWRRRSPEEITLVYNPSDPEKAVMVLFDGERTGLHGNSQMFRLLVEVCQLARETPTGNVDMAQLEKNDTIWDAAVTSKQVRQRLYALKRQYLGDALLLDGTIRLCARVKSQTNSG